MENSPVDDHQDQDEEISRKMRFDNYEQFKTLVRMHLSFELDLNTDEFDLPCHEVIYYEKGKLKKWNRLSKKMKSCTSAVKNSPLDNNYIHLTLDFIEQLKKLKEFLLKEENLNQEGIFRRTGAVSRQNELRSLINQQKSFDLNENYSVHDCATVYKSYLADLPEPLLTDAHYPAHCQIADLCNEVKNTVDNKKGLHLLNSVQLLVLLLPEENRLLLKDIIEMLNITAKYEKCNKMSADTLATLFSPHLICPRNLPPEALHYVSQAMTGVISYMISKGLEIFEIPAKLDTDCRAYYHEMKRKKTMSPEQTLDESISDISTVNTVYTFVDREKTAAAHNSNPTDTALAQLYAHIQSLPESSKKRKLIKQFNKENGQGTPLQLLMVNRGKVSELNRSAKSISDSIKKHIFNKGIISRTPKRSNANTNFSTPNGAPKNPKLRVLFQSPISTISSQHHPPGTPSTSCTLKSHPLQKSVSSSSLLTASNIQITVTGKIVNNTSNQIDKKPASASAPVSRIGSSDLENMNSDTYKTDCIASQTNILSEASAKLQGTPLAWQNDQKLDDEEEISTPTQNTNISDLKSKYKSEPNLSRISRIQGNNCDSENTDVDYSKESNKSFASKLIKGVSLGNLRLPFTTFDKSKNVKRAASLLIRKISKTDCFGSDEILNPTTPCKNDLQITEDDCSIDEADASSDVGSETDNETSQNLNIYRNIDLITSTPSHFLGRRSMSPITKSTQRMPKAMQESIMTPRSRKPVMLMATTLGSSEQNQTTYQLNDLSNFNEQDEDSYISKPQKDADLIKNTNENSDKPELFKLSDENNQLKQNTESESLTNTFREYLLSRSVLTESPVDSSFSSQPDDFGSATDIQNITESQMSSSLLYFLDGNDHPENESHHHQSLSEISNEECPSSSSYAVPRRSSMSTSHCDNIGISSNLLNNRKRSSNSIAYQTENSIGGDSDYNCQNDIKTKKLLVIKENPGETSL